MAVSALGGVVLPLAAARDAAGIGWNAGVAAHVTFPSGVGVRVDYLYSRFGAADKTVDVTLGPLLPAFAEVPVSAKTQMHAGSLDLTWTVHAGEARVYVMAGPSVFRRRVQLTGSSPTSGGIATACEPLWLQCRAEVIGFDRWLGIKQSDDLGFNVGAGIAIPTGLTATLVVEARYFRVAGPTFRSAEGGASRSSSASFLPISVGLRF